jgi:hypothetical protein
LGKVVAQKIGWEDVVGYLEGSLGEDGRKRVESDLARPSGSEARAIMERIARAAWNMQHRRTKEHIHRSLGIPAEDPMGPPPGSSSSAQAPDPMSDASSGPPAGRSWADREASGDHRGRELK